TRATPRSSGSRNGSTRRGAPRAAPPDDRGSAVQPFDRVPQRADALGRELNERAWPELPGGVPRGPHERAERERIAALQLSQLRRAGDHPGQVPGAPVEVALRHLVAV